MYFAKRNSIYNVEAINDRWFVKLPNKYKDARGGIIPYTWDYTDDNYYFLLGINMNGKIADAGGAVEKSDPDMVSAAEREFLEETIRVLPLPNSYSPETDYVAYVTQPTTKGKRGILLFYSILVYYDNLTREDRDNIVKSFIPKRAATKDPKEKELASIFWDSLDSVRGKLQDMYYPTQQVFVAILTKLFR